MNDSQRCVKVLEGTQQLVRPLFYFLFFLRLSFLYFVLQVITAVARILHIDYVVSGCLTHVKHSDNVWVQHEGVQGHLSPRKLMGSLSLVFINTDLIDKLFTSRLDNHYLHKIVRTQ